MTRPEPLASGERELIDRCRAASIDLLKRNLSTAGILAATPGALARSRGYTAIFARDTAVCAFGMALSGDRELERAAPAGLLTLAEHQAPNGQIPKFVDVGRAEADFWYLGCIDATLWWLIGLAFLDRVQPAGRLVNRLEPAVRRAVHWAQCQEHQRFFLLQQNEASDWADIMPRSGFVLYTNALWYLVKRLFDLPGVEDTRRSANELFHPFSASLAEYRRARLLAHYVRRDARHRDLYLSFVNFSFYGDEGDVFGNVLAVLCGLADAAAAKRTLDALDRARIGEPWPVRVVCDPILEESIFWRPYMSRHKQNLAWQYHNGGIWPFVGGFWVTALAERGDRTRAERELAKLAAVNALDGWAFTEWLNGQTGAPGGMRGQSWNAATFLMALHAVGARAPVFGRLSGGRALR
ncbi:MAG TPA: glycoside hydrolase 100 family protein [Burkholderiales bacterium]|jgi:glycogen debranching enzyme|nr:glycoside hydrolase 100 family protein [Burkholderiales bacterium]